MKLVSEKTVEAVDIEFSRQLNEGVKLVSEEAVEAVDMLVSEKTVEAVDMAHPTIPSFSRPTPPLHI